LFPYIAHAFAAKLNEQQLYVIMEDPPFTLFVVDVYSTVHCG
jgi:hypothetical protein